MENLTIKDVRKNKIYYFKLVNKKGEASKMIYYLNGYDRSTKKYSISNVNDICSEKFVKATQKITIDFEY